VFIEYNRDRPAERSSRRAGCLGTYIHYKRVIRSKSEPESSLFETKKNVSEPPSEERNNEPLYPRSLL